MSVYILVMLLAYNLLCIKIAAGADHKRFSTR